MNTNRLKYHNPSLIYCVPNTNMIMELNDNFIIKYEDSDLIDLCSFSLERYFIFKDISELMSNATRAKTNWKM